MQTEPTLPRGYDRKRRVRTAPVAIASASAVATGGSVASAPAFTPASRIATVAIWLRADTGIGVANGAPVTSWADTLSPSGLTLTTKAGIPLFVAADAHLGGQPSVAWAVGSYMNEGAGPTLSQPTTIYTVVYYLALAAANFFDGVSARQIVAITSGHYDLYAGTHLAGGVAATNAALMMIGSFAATSNLYVNSSSVVNATGSAGAAGLTGVQLNGTTGAVGTTAEVIVCTGTDSLAVRGQMAGYFATRYGQAWT